MARLGPFLKLRRATRCFAVRQNRASPPRSSVSERPVGQDLFPAGQNVQFFSPVTHVGFVELALSQTDIHDIANVARSGGNQLEQDEIFG